MQIVTKDSHWLAAQRARTPLVLCSYDWMTKPHARTVCGAEKWFKVVVVDESHNIKNHKVRPQTCEILYLPIMPLGLFFVVAALYNCRVATCGGHH